MASSVGVSTATAIGGGSIELSMSIGGGGQPVQSMSSETFKGFNEAMAHSSKQNINRSHFSKADGTALKQNYEDFFA